MPGGHACGAAAPQSSGGRAAGTCAPGLRIHTCLRIAAPPAWLSADMCKRCPGRDPPKKHKNNSRKTGSYKYVPLKALLHARCKEGLLLLPAENGFVNGVQILRGIIGDNDLPLLLIPVDGHSGSQPAAECSGHTPQIGIPGFFAAPVGIQ